MVMGPTAKKGPLPSRALPASPPAEAVRLGQGTMAPAAAMATTAAGKVAAYEDAPEYLPKLFL